MKLVELNVRNFRSLEDIRGIPFRKQTILTGHNDCGKTAVLDALAFLLGEGAVGPSDVSDFAENPGRGLSFSQRSQIFVEGSFELSPAEQTGLGLPSPVSVRRRFRAEEGDAVLEAKLEVPEDPSLRDMGALGLTELRELAEKHGIPAAGRANAKGSWLEPLTEYAATLRTVQDWTPADSVVREALPRMVYFKGDLAHSPEAVVRSILSAKLREYAKNEATQKKIGDLEDEFAELLQHNADRLRERVERQCGLDSLSLHPKIQFKPSVESLDMAASVGGQKEVPLSAAGAGRSRRIALALWESTQELLADPDTADDDTAVPPRDVVIVYDEPDTHLDYEHQRRIMQMIKMSAAAPHSSVIVSTHSLNLIDGVDIQDIVHLGSSKGRAEIRSLGAGSTDKDIRRFMSNIAVSLGFRNSVLLHCRRPFFLIGS